MNMFLIKKKKNITMKKLLFLTIVSLPLKQDTSYQFHDKIDKNVTSKPQNM